LKEKGRPNHFEGERLGTSDSSSSPCSFAAFLGNWFEGGYRNHTSAPKSSLPASLSPGNPTLHFACKKRGPRFLEWQM